MSQEPHYECAVTGELHPKSDLFEVNVSQMELGGNRTFNVDQVGTAFVTPDLFADDYTSVNILAIGPTVEAIYKADATYGQIWPVPGDRVDEDKAEDLQAIADTVINSV